MADAIGLALKTRVSHLALCLAVIFFSGAAAVAAQGVQDISASADANEGISVYPPEFFAGYYPVTALDMVRQVPGFTINNGDRVRGFGGAAGNVLIDGERPSTKSDTLENILQRIPADRVDHIELIRGSAPNIDMRGLSRVVNVVLKQGQETAQNNWTLSSTYARRRIIVNGEFVHNATVKGASITLGLLREGGPFRTSGIERRFAPPGTLSEHRDEFAQRFFRFWQPTFNLEKKFDDGRFLHLNAKATDQRFDRNEPSFVQQPLPGGALSFLRFDNNVVKTHDQSTEFGGDYSLPLNKAMDLKFIGLRNSTVAHDRFFSSSIDNAGAQSASRIFNREKSVESIARSVLDWKLGKKHSLQLTAEGALNSLNANLQLEQDNGTGFEVVVLPVTDTRVKERRAEFSASWVYVPNPKLTVESGLKYETSRLSQSGDASRTRHFSFPKPSLSISYNTSKKDQLRFNIERKVAQLDFGDFVTSVNLTDNQTDVGNPELEPDRTWSAKLSWERRFSKKGSVTLTGQRDWITQVQGLVPIGNTFDAPGNLGNARRWTLNLTARLPMDRLGLKNATLDVTGFLRDSAVTDPVTGRRRVLENEPPHNFTLDFRQDLSARKIAWGWTYNNGLTRRRFRLFEEQVSHVGGGSFGGGNPRALSVFIETTKIKGMTATFDIRNVLNRPNERTRIFFDGPRSTGMIEAIETQRRKAGLRYRIRLRGSF